MGDKEEYNYLNYFRNTRSFALDLRFLVCWEDCTDTTVLKPRRTKVGNHHKPFCSIKLHVSKVLPSNVCVQKELERKQGQIMLHYNSVCLA